MAIKLSKNNLCINQIIEQKTEKMVIEGDEIVPDVKPDVLSIVSANGNVCMYKKEVQDGKIKLEGTVSSYVVYVADDENSSIRALNANIDFSKTIEMKSIKNGMDLGCKTDLTNIECRILNGRKISLKASVQVGLTVYSDENIEYIDTISERNDIQTLNDRISVNSIIGKGDTKVYAKDTVAIDNTDNLSEIMKVEINLENKENKISYNKILTKADTIVRIMYLTDDGRINTVSATIPVMGFIDMQNINEDSISDVNYELKNLIIKPNNVAEHSIHAEAEFEINCIVYRKQEINIIQDLYSKTTDISFTQKTIRLVREKQEVKETLNIRKQESIDEIRQNKIYDVDVKPRIISSQIENGKVTYQGEINFTFVYAQDNTSRISVKTLVEPFDFTVTSASMTTKSKIETTMEIAKKDFVVMPDSTIDIKVDINFKSNIIKDSEINLIETINESESKKKENFSIVIYYTRVGDTLWKIAKKFGSTVDEIVKINSIENQDMIMPGEQLFIPR